MAKSKYKDVKDRLIDLVKRGVTVKLACDAVSISQNTYYEYIKQYPEFKEAITQARGERAAALVEKVLRYSEPMMRVVRYKGEPVKDEKGNVIFEQVQRGDWRGPMEMLRVLHPDGYMKRDPEIENLRKQFDSVVDMFSKFAKHLPEDKQQEFANELIKNQPRGEEPEDEELEAGETEDDKEA